MTPEQELTMTIRIRQALADSVTNLMIQLRAENASFQYRFGVNGIRNDINWEIIKLQNRLKHRGPA